MADAAEQQWRNPAAVLHGVDDLRFEEHGLPVRVPAVQVRVEMKAVGICGSDVHYLKHGRIADFVVTSPMVIGHESAGTVAAVGEGVTGLAVGDRVALEPGIPCWHNRASREGRYNLDPDITFFATPPHHGSLARFVDHPAAFCYKLPPGLSHEHGAFCEPLSVGVHACRRGGVAPGKSVAILGAGPIGLVTLLVARAFGADAIAITDVRPEPLAAAARLGATATLLQAPGTDPKEAGAQLRAALPPQGPDVIIDCAGFESTVQTALAACVAGGRVVLVGMGQAQARLPIDQITVRELDLVGSFRYANTYDLCISLMASGRVNVDPLITHRYGFSARDIADGFDTAARSAQTGAIKVMFNLP